MKQVASSTALAFAAILAVAPAAAQKCPIADDLPVPTQEMWSNFRARCEGANVRGCLKAEWSEQEYEQAGRKFKIRMQKNTCDHQVVMLALGCTNGAMSGHFIRTLEAGALMPISSVDPATGAHSFAFRNWTCKPKASGANVSCSFADKTC